MKNQMVLLCIVLVILVGCTANDNGMDTKDESTNILIEDDSHNDNQSQDDVINNLDDSLAISITSHDTIDSYNIDESIKVAELYNGGILYFGEKNSIFIEDEDTTIIVDEYFSSYPEISPNNKLIAYIDSVDFESIGNLCIYDLDTGENIQKTRFDYTQSDSVKIIEWIDDDHVLLIIGFVFGTISQGRDLYCYDFNEGTLELLIVAEQDTEIIDVKLSGDKIILTKLFWIDDNYMEYKTIEEEMFVAEL